MLPRAKELLYKGRWLTGAEAESCGLVLKAVVPSDLEGEVNRLVDKIVEKSTAGLAEIKRLSIEG